MKKHLILFFLFILAAKISAQSERQNERFHLHISFGRSLNGTGDISGYQYGLEIGRYLRSSKFYWSVGLEGTLHDEETINFFFEDDQGNNLDGKSRFVTGGIQIVGGLGYQPVNNNRHNFGLSLGPLLRYQSSSIPDIVEITFPVATDLPFPIQQNIFREPFRTVSLGAALKIKYAYCFGNNFFLGLLGGIQTDTNGDTISQVAVMVGKKF